MLIDASIHIPELYKFLGLPNVTVSTAYMYVQFDETGHLQIHHSSTASKKLHSNHEFTMLWNNTFDITLRSFCDFAHIRDTFLEINVFFVKNSHNTKFSLKAEQHDAGYNIIHKDDRYMSYDWCVIIYGTLYITRDARYGPCSITATYPSSNIAAVGFSIQGGPPLFEEMPALKELNYDNTTIPLEIEDYIQIRLQIYKWFRMVE